MAYNVADIENFVRSFIVSEIKKTYPDLDISSNSSYDDLFIKPLASVFDKVVSKVSDIEFMYSLSDPENMSDDDLDQIGTNNYLLERNGGEKSTAILTLSYVKIPDSGSAIINEGDTFSTDTGLDFMAITTYTFSAQELQNGYNPSSLTYDVDIMVVAAAPGAEYRVGENSITQFIASTDSFLLQVTNKVAAVGGTDSESNTDYADRMKKYHLTRNLGTHPGYLDAILSNATEVEDARIVGKDDEGMERDLFGVILSDGSVKNIHIGGKVDMYIKGSLYEYRSDTFTYNGPRLLLSRKPDVVDIESFQVYNTQTGQPVTTFEIIFDTDSVIIFIQNEGAYEEHVKTPFKVIYSINSGGGAVTVIDNFIVGGSILELTLPVSDTYLVEIINDDNSLIELEPWQYEIMRYDPNGLIIDSTSLYYRTSLERCLLKVVDDTIPNDTQIKVSYSMNQTINKLKDYFDARENRLITTDIMIKNAYIIPINISITIKLKVGYLLDSTKISIITSSVSEFLKAVGLGGAFQESDIVGWFYKENNIMEFLDYIDVPFLGFYIPENIHDEVLNIRQSTEIALGNFEYPVLNKIKIEKRT